MTRAVDEIDLFDPGSLDDPYPLYDRLRRTAPVHRVDGTDFYLVSRWDLVVEAAIRPADFSSHLTAALVHQPDGSASVFDMDGEGQAVHVLATADDPEHLRQRKLVLPALVAKRIRALEPTMQANVRRLWDEGVEAERLESPFRAHHRHVVADTTLGGVDLPAGTHLLLLWGAANRDPAVFPDADRLRLDRTVQRGHLAFGKGVHFCVGAALARLEARVALGALLAATASFEPAPTMRLNGSRASSCAGTRGSRSSSVELVQCGCWAA